MKTSDMYLPTYLEGIWRDTYKVGWIWHCNLFKRLRFDTFLKIHKEFLLRPFTFLKEVYSSMKEMSVNLCKQDFETLGEK